MVLRNEEKITFEGIGFKLRTVVNKAVTQFDVEFSRNQLTDFLTAGLLGSLSFHIWNNLDILLL